MDHPVLDRFLQLLRSEHGLDQKILLAIMAEAERKKVSFVSCLISKNLAQTPYLLRWLAKLCGLSLAQLDTEDRSDLPIHLLPKKWFDQHQALPLWQRNGVLGLALCDPTEQQLIEDVRFHTSFRVETILVQADQLQGLLSKIRDQLTSSKKRDELESMAFSKSNGLTSRSFFVEWASGSLDNEAEVIQIVDRLLRTATERGASDIHIEPHQHQLSIRFRIDGLLYPVVSAPVSATQRIVSRFKIMSQLDIAERRIPQDGRFQIKDGANRMIDCRISICPTLFGEKLVIRILDSHRMLLDIDQLGMNNSQKEDFLRALRAPQGMILVTGPTGSGKTVTLYTALNLLNTEHVNISSVENPIEIVLSGVNQVQVNPKVGLSFATVLRAFLRQDPDIIMVGEMRDQETAEIGIKAAQTGHLVLSSLHTNSAAESLVRLLNMGISRYDIAFSAYLIVAQRLVRRLCPYCKEKDELPEAVLRELGLNAQDIRTTVFFTARACPKCTEGYRERTGVFEILVITDEIRSLILRDVDAREIALWAQRNGMRTLYLSALEKLKQGEISLLEMKRVIKD